MNGTDEKTSCVDEVTDRAGNIFTTHYLVCATHLVCTARYFIYTIRYLVCTTLYPKSGGNESCQFFLHDSLPHEVTNRAWWAEEYYHIHFSLNSCLYFKIKFKRFKVKKILMNVFKSTFKSYRGIWLNS